MRSKKPFSAGKPTFVIFITLLLASAIVPNQAQAQTFKVLHTFHGKDGGAPITQLAIDGAGNFYGTTAEGGTGTCTPGPGCGTVFKLNKSGKLLWSHSFNFKDGWEPLAGVFRDSAGNLFGTTASGGKVTNACGGPPGGGCGVVFKLDASGRETVVYRFIGSPDGYVPEALLVEDADANLYGTTDFGGTSNDGGGGTAFKVSQAGREVWLHSFGTLPDGGSPGPGLILRPDGKLYGAAAAGGNSGGGIVFRISTRGKESIVYNFPGGSYGRGPSSILTADSAGNLYGTSPGGGSNCGIDGCGTVFELSPGSGGWTQKTLYVFCQLSQCADGERPLSGPLVIDGAGNIYGTTYFGGAYRNCNGDACGVVFKLDATGKETVLHSFTGGADGANPWAGLTMDSTGNLYGTTEVGGDLNCTVDRPYGCGLVFEITP
jgi:uncharacterized repeat protein (TIGR03803 family)